MTFLEKSDQNRIAAKMLREQNLHASSVNRYFYSYLQYLFHILANKLKKSKEDLEEFQKDREGSHRFALRMVGDELASKNIKDYKWLQRVDKELKALRVDSDYFEIAILSTHSYDAENKSQTLINCLKVNFK